MTIFADALNPTSEIKKATGQAHPSRQMLVMWEMLTVLQEEVSKLKRDKLKERLKPKKEVSHETM